MSLYLIDGMSFVFRAFHAMQQSGLKSPDGTPTGAVFGFINSITSILDNYKPEQISVVFDTSAPTFRHKKYVEYKANREAFPEDLIPQLELIKKFLDLAGIHRIEKDGFEADDIIGTLAKKASSENIDVKCLTSDKDFYQLVDDHISLLKPQFKGNGFDTVGFTEVNNKFGVSPDKVIDVLAIIGDSVDNVPGVKGVGEKSAIPLVQEYGSLESIYENLDKIIKKAVKNKLEEHKEKAFISRDLVTIDINVPIEPGDVEFSLKKPDFPQLDMLFQSLGFRQIREKWRDRSGMTIVEMKESKQEFDNSGTQSIKSVEHEYVLVDSEEKLDDMLSDLEKHQLICFDLETSSLDRDTCTVVGIALSGEENKAFYIGFDERDNIELKQKGEGLFAGNEIQEEYENCLPVMKTLDKLKPILESPGIGKCGQNSKFDTYILSRYGVEVTPVVFDSMLASYLLDPDEKHGMDALALKWLQYETVSIKSLIGEKKKEQKSMRSLHPAEICDYACEDADITLKLCNLLKKELEEAKLTQLGEKVEFPMVEVLTRMERNGIALDTETLSELSVEIADRAKELTSEIYEEAGSEFNIDSPKQLGHILFEKMMIPPVKKTKSGFSTDVQVLNQLADIYPIADKVLEYRQLVKLKSTYIDALPKLVNPLTGRIHTTYNQTVASTGRLSSTDPNLQNIPIRSELGKEVRRAFVTGTEGNLIFSADYSQVELRIMAYICNDKQMVDGFKQGLDIHAATSAVLYGVSLDEVTQDMRRIAKTVNFGIMYGLGAFGLSQRLNIPRKEAAEIIDNYIEKYPGIRKYIDLTIESTRKKGYAETLMGRRRHFPQIRSENRNLRTAAERGAINMPIQGTAADMMKVAMIRIDEELRRRNLKSLMMLQVHDELVFEAIPEELDELQEVVINGMQRALPLGEVPVVVDTGTGRNWFEAH